MPLAVLGGSFDPVHCGHVEMAQHVLKHGLARDVLIVPASRSPFKSHPGTSDEHRLAMLRLAFSSCENCRIDQRELLRGGASYMVETLEELRAEFPNRKLRLIIGGDNVAGFSDWHRYQDILKIARIIVLGRQDHSMNVSRELQPFFISASDFDQRVSSTEIRAILADGGPASDLLPVGVMKYIHRQGLYR